jgi:hypothetical protein
MSRRPNTFIIGKPKSGTTSLYEYLDGHPEVFMSPVKEPFYFAPDLNVGGRRRFVYDEHDHSRYLSLFAEAGDEKRVGEASPGYLMSHVAASLVRRFAPDARLIAMFRNPVDMLYSLHHDRVSHGTEDITDFAAALAADDDRRNGRRLPPGRPSLAAVYRDSARYAEQLQRWLDCFDRDQIHVIVFDDFVADTAAQFRNVLEFLGVDPDYQPATFVVRNASKQLRGGVVRRVLAGGPALWLRDRALPRVVGEANAARLGRAIRHSRVSRRPTPRPPLSAGLRAELEEELMPEVARLSQMLGRDLGKLWFGRPALAPGYDLSLVAQGV